MVRKLQTEEEILGGPAPNEVEERPSQERLIEQINECHGKHKVLIRKTVELAIEEGRLACELKTLAGHGHFEEIKRTKFTRSARGIESRMKLYRFSKNPDFKIDYYKTVTSAINAANGWNQDDDDTTGENTTSDEDVSVSPSTEIHESIFEPTEQNAKWIATAPDDHKKLTGFITGLLVNKNDLLNKIKDGLLLKTEDAA